MGHRSGTASQHIHFVPCKPKKGRKHFTYEVRALMGERHGEILGTIHIYPRWRGWVLAPERDTIWSASCLDLVREFIKTRNAEMRSSGRRIARESKTP